MVQVPHDDVAKKFGVHRTKVKELQESAGKFALMVAAFCECLGWSDLDILISKFQVLVSLFIEPPALLLSLGCQGLQNLRGLNCQVC